MAKYQLTDPNGAVYEIEAPDENTAVAALGHLSKATEVSATPQAEQPKSLLQSVDDYVRAAANGMTFGLADRLAAAAGAVTGIGGKAGDYAGNLKNEQARTEEFATEHPVANIAANVAGGVAVPLGAVGAAGRAASLGGKMLAGAGAGAGIGAVQGAAESRDWTDLPQTARDAIRGAAIGSTIGGAIPAAGRVIGAGYNAMANAVRGGAEGVSRPASRHLVDAMLADGPDAVQARVAKLGPDAMLADAGPAFLGKAQGASLNSDEGRSLLQGALTARNEGTNARIMGDVNRALGPAEDPQTVTNAIRGHRSEVDSISYPAALNNAPPVQTAPILQTLEDMIPRSVGMERKALTNLRDMMMTTERRPLLDTEGFPQYDYLGHQRFVDAPISQNNADVLHKIKQELDNVIEYDAPGLGLPASALSRQQGALKYLRRELNDALEQQVPGYRAANTVSAALARRADAVEAGTQYLGGGKTTASPERFAAEFQQMPVGEQIAFAKGSRGNIERALGTKANDLQALRLELQGEGGWNTAKIGTVHGDQAAQDLVDSVDRNLRFRDTFSKVVENSQTAQRQAAAGAMKPVPPGEVALINPNMSATGFALAGAKNALKAGYNAIRPDQTRAFGEIAQILTEQGAKRDQRIADIIAALDRRRGNQRVAATAGNRAALLAAIAANGYARSGPRQNRD